MTKNFLDSWFGINDFADNILPHRGPEVAAQLDVNLHELRAAEPDWSVLVEAAKITLIFARIQYCREQPQSAERVDTCLEGRGVTSLYGRLIVYLWTVCRYYSWSVRVCRKVPQDTVTRSRIRIYHGDSMRCPICGELHMSLQFVPCYYLFSGESAPR